MAEVTPTIAAETVVVHDDNLNIDRKVFAGQAVPPDLVDAYEAKVGDKAVSSDDDNSPNYSRQKVADLEAEVEKRGLEVEGSGEDGKVVKADLVAALEADDAKDD